MFYISDIDECALNLHDCAANEVCVNDEGYYYCEDPSNTAETEYNLAKCPEGYTFNGVKQVCDGNTYFLLFQQLLFSFSYLCNAFT